MLVGCIVNLMKITQVCSLIGIDWNERWTKIWFMKIVKVGLYILKYMYIVYKCLIYKQIFFLKYIHACIYIYLIHVHNAHTYMWPWSTKPVIRFLKNKNIEIYASSKSWINDISIDAWFMTGQYLECEGAKNLNIEKIIFKFVQIKFLAIHITNQKLCFDIFTEGRWYL